MSIRITLYEDNDRLRKTMSQLIEMSESLILTGAHPNCLSAVENQKENPADVVLMDIDMPGISGIEGVRLLREAYPEINVLMLTVFDDNDNVFNAVCAGATGYLLKKTPPFKIVDAIHDIYNGGAPMNAHIARKVLGMFSGMRATVPDYALTKREKEILKQLVSGNSYKIIASELNVSIDTVRYHIKNIYNKLHVHSMSEAVAKAIRERIVH